MHQNHVLKPSLKLSKSPKGDYQVSFTLNGKRHRYSSGSAIDVKLHPNRLPKGRLRDEAAQELLLCFREAVRNGWCPAASTESGLVGQEQTLLEGLKYYRPASHLSQKYIVELDETKERLLEHFTSIGAKDIMPSSLDHIQVLRYLESVTSTPSTFNHERGRVSSILASLDPRIQGAMSPTASIPQKRTAQALHKPFEEIQEVLEDVERFNKKLFLCCLLTYGCLLRPHREIRLLRWSDFAADLSAISLPGNRNKSRRNRIVPVPGYVSVNLPPRRRNEFVFTGSQTPPGKDYFKGLWTRYKKQSSVVSSEQTLYSFRHTAAIDIFNRTASVNVLKEAMGHASMAVTLGYLRNLEIPQLTHEDMPALKDWSRIKV